MKFSGKSAIITGVSKKGQIGEALARAFASEGADIVIAARSKDNLQDRLDELKSLGVRAIAVPTDATNQKEVDNLIGAALAEFGKIDILVNAAGGLTKIAPAVELSPGDWDYELSINLKTAFLCSKAALPSMMQRNYGKIVNFSSVGGLDPKANLVAYNCAKAGVIALTRTLALETRNKNIYVNAVAPGLVDTEQNIEAMKPKDTSRWVKRQDVANVVLFLASEESDGITGQVIPVFGKGI